MTGDRARAENVCGACPVAGGVAGPCARRARAFFASIDAIRADPERRLWGDSLCIARDGVRRVIGSVVFHGRPDDGIAEVGYGIEEGSQRLGFATEATGACVEWAPQAAESMTAVRDDGVAVPSRRRCA